MATATLIPTMTSEDGEEVKLRSVCDACTSAKVRCNGKVPCERCLKRGIECHYLPFKSRGGDKASSSTGNAKTSSKAATARQSNAQAARHSTAHLSDSMLDANEKKIWSVFFTLYRSFGKGCAQFWFKQQLFKMLRFLEGRAGSDPSSSSALIRLKGWMGALGIDVQSPPDGGLTRPPHLKYQNIKTPFFQATVDELRNEVARRRLPMLYVSREGCVEVNEAFVNTFVPDVPLMQRALEESAGGFLPWAGDLLARIFCRESDLILYIQGVANNLDAIGKPPTVPYIQAVPSMNILHVYKKTANGGVQDVLCVVRSVQMLHVDPLNMSIETTVVFDIPDESEVGKVPAKARVYSETVQSSGMDQSDDGFAAVLEENTSPGLSKMLKEQPLEEQEQQLPPLPDSMLEDDGEWLDNLLNWASSDAQLQGDHLAALPIADDMLDSNDL